jgi:dTDP-4-dehydrorhamnose reductase
MRILVTGANGQVGWELSRSLLPLGEVIALDRTQADLSKPESLVPIVRTLKPQIIVNAAAYTAVDRAESEEELATLVNARSVEVLAEESHRLGALLIHYSTDYVFDGSKASPYSEDDTVNPLNAYGRSKLMGEQAIRNIGGDWLIFRTSWVYAERGKNFVKTILRLAAEREELKIVGDQTGSPTSAPFIADATSHILRLAIEERRSTRFNSGIFHLTSSGFTTWHGLATAIVATYRKLAWEDSLKVKEIHSIQTSDYPVAAKRPMNSRMSLTRIQERFDLYLPEWEQCLSVCLRELV